MLTIAPLATATEHASVPAWLITPFGLLILLIAVMPLTGHRGKHLWEKGHPIVALALGGFVAAWYLLRVPGGGAEVLNSLHEYASFIALVGSLYIVAGGLHVGVRGSATPWENTRFLALGGLAANFIGTTGASMVLIRPFLRMNAGRAAPHHVVFFIFVVSNCGGALTPIGDPPLFIGFLRGVPFFWLAKHALPQWLCVMGALLAMFWWIDRRAFRRAGAKLRAAAADKDHVALAGRINIVFLAALIGAVFLPASSVGLREGVMLAIAYASYRFTPRGVHDTNGFSFGPIREVAVLFFGIFLTMMPALEGVSKHGREFGVEQPLEYYATTGALSAVLDNAPTYATFFQLAQSSTHERSPEDFPAGRVEQRETTRALLRSAPELIIATSLGAVFFGAMTYIGNGPNFMVKAIAEEAGVPAPSFFGYLLRYAIPLLLPVLLLVGWIFM
jgi:Na+/H+ antiporter NhaD/arsenite permease-like protein